MNSNTPKVSVIMAVYNGETYLSEAILSVLNQTEKNFEYIIIDDGSTDDSQKIIKSFHDERIVYFKKIHSGLVDSLNLGLQKARTEFIARFDADDICMPERLEKQLSFFEQHPENVLVGSYAVKIDEFGEEIGTLEYPPLAWPEIKKYSLLHNPFIHPTVMFRRELIRIVGDYRNFKHAEDYELWTRIIYKYPCANIDEPLLKYRVHTGQITEKRKITSIFIRFFALFRFLFA